MPNYRNAAHGPRYRPFNEAEIKDCESTCFECGKPDPEIKIDDGVKLCQDCRRKETPDAN